MATIDDVRAGILESEVYDGALKGGEPVELTITLLDLHGDTLPFAQAVREEGAEAFGMLFFTADSATCPKHGVMWTRFEDGLQLTPEDSERHLFDDKKLVGLCIRVTATFLDALAHRDAKYAPLAPPRVH